MGASFLGKENSFKKTRLNCDVFVLLPPKKVHYENVNYLKMQQRE